LDSTRGTHGRLIVIEGIDGAGKSTLQRGLAESLRARGRTVLCTKEPTDGPLGQRIRALARDGRGSVSPEEELALFHEDRRQHVQEVVRPALERGEVVIQDRSFHSTVAYQGERGLDRAELWAKSLEIAPLPDLLLVVDLPAEVALERIRKNRAGADDFEQLDGLRRIRSTFLGFPGALVLDGTLPPETLLDAAEAALRPVISEP
jgi:dTMP kinase